MPRLLDRLLSAGDGLVQALRRTRLRRRGVTLGPGCRIGRHVSAAGTIHLGSRTVLQDNVVLAGDIRIGQGVTVQKLAELAGHVEIADDATIGAYSFISTMPDGRVRIGRRVLVNAYTVIGAGLRVDIGDDCIFAPHIDITDSTHAFERRDDSPRHGPASSRPVQIGQGTWLGAGVKVLQGVTLGEGCVIGAGSVVTRDLPAYAIAVGTPARVLRLRAEPADNHLEERRPA